MARGSTITHILGFVGKAPELTYTTKKTAVATFSLAVNSSYKNSEGEDIERTTWHPMRAYGGRAEALAKHLNKGSLINVTCVYESESYEDKKTGERKYAHRFVIQDFDFVMSGKNDEATEEAEDDEE